MKAINFCCDFLIETMNDAGNKGFAIIPKKIEHSNYVFILQARSLDANDKNGNLFIVQRAIKYCPFCGIELKSIIKDCYQEIEKLAEKNKELLL